MVGGTQEEGSGRYHGRRRRLGKRRQNTGILACSQSFGRIFIYVLVLRVRGRGVAPAVHA